MENSSLAGLDSIAAPPAASGHGVSSHLPTHPHPPANEDGGLLAELPPLPPSPADVELEAARAALSLSEARVEDLHSKLEEARAALARDAERVEKAAASFASSSPGSEGGGAAAPTHLLPPLGTSPELASARSPWQRARPSSLASSLS